MDPEAQKTPPSAAEAGCEPPRGHRPLSAAHLAALLDTVEIALRHQLLSTADRVLISLTRASSPGGLPLRGLCRVTLPEWSAEPREAERQCWGHRGGARPPGSSSSWSPKSQQPSCLVHKASAVNVARKL